MVTRHAGKAPFPRMSSVLHSSYLVVRLLLTPITTWGIQPAPQHQLYLLPASHNIPSHIQLSTSHPLSCLLASRLFPGSSTSGWGPAGSLEGITPMELLFACKWSIQRLLMYLLNDINQFGTEKSCLFEDIWQESQGRGPVWAVVCSVFQLMPKARTV